MTDSKRLLTDRGFDSDNKSAGFTPDTASPFCRDKTEEESIIGDEPENIQKQAVGDTYTSTREGQAMKLVSELEAEMAWLYFPDKAYVKTLSQC